MFFPLFFYPPLSHWQIFVGKIPRDLFEDELVPLFEKAGPIWDLRLMMDPLSGLNRGYAFVTFCTKEAAQQAVKLVRPLRRMHNGLVKASRTQFDHLPFFFFVVAVQQQ